MFFIAYLIYMALIAGAFLFVFSLLGIVIYFFLLAILIRGLWWHFQPEAKEMRRQWAVKYPTRKERLAASLRLESPYE